MTAQDYAVSFPYGAQDGVYYGIRGSVGKYHRGNDRPCPNGTPVVIGQYTIGWTGATGVAFGFHLHTQACPAGSYWASDLNPSMYEFKFGTVVQAGWHAQFGNYVMIRVGGVDITYAHLSRINVSAGQVLSPPAQPKGIDEVADRGQVDRLYRMILFRGGDEGGLNNYTGRNANQIVAEMEGSTERKNLEANINWTREHANNLQNIVNSQQAALADLEAKRQSAEATASEKTEALNKLLAEFKKTTNQLADDKQAIDELDAEHKKAIEVSKANSTVQKTSWWIGLLAALFTRKKK